MRSSRKALVLLSAAAIVGLTLAGRGLDRPATASNQNIELSFAVVDTIGLLEQLLQTPEYQGSRDTARINFETQLAQLQTMNNATITLLQNMPQDDPSYQMNVAQYQNQQAQMQQLNGQFGLEIDSIASTQAIEIYATITTAINTVADREGIDNVLSNRAAPELGTAMGLAGVTQQILARPVVRTSALDLTVAVRDELGLPDPAVVAAEAAAAEAAAQAEAQTAQAEALEQLRALQEAAPAVEPAAEPADEEGETEADDGEG